MHASVENADGFDPVGVAAQTVMERLLGRVVAASGGQVFEVTIRRGGEEIAERIDMLVMVRRRRVVIDGERTG